MLVHEKEDEMDVAILAKGNMELLCHEDLKPGDYVIGRGGFGKVTVRRYYNKKGEKVKRAIKDGEPKSMLVEIAAMLSIMEKPHANIIKMDCYNDTANPPFISYPYYPLNLKEYCEKGNLLFNPDKVESAFKQITRGLCHLHMKLEILHRDVKLANVLIDTKSFQLVIADLGGSRRLFRNNKPWSPFVGTLVNNPPELIQAFFSEEMMPNGYGPEVDWWQAGILLVDMLRFTNDDPKPYPMKHPAWVDDDILDADKDYTAHYYLGYMPWFKRQGFGNDWNNLVSRLLSLDPKGRPEDDEMLLWSAEKRVLSGFW